MNKKEPSTTQTQGIASLFGERETLGSQLFKTQQEHLRGSSVEAGELSHAGGKSYMRELFDCMQANSSRKGDYFILALCSKLPPSIGQNRAIIFCFGAIQGSPSYVPDMRPSLDCWRVNNEKESLRLEWSLPDYEEMPKFLNDPSAHDRSLIGWIKDYEKIQARRRKS